MKNRSWIAPHRARSRAGQRSPLHAECGQRVGPTLQATNLAQGSVAVAPDSRLFLVGISFRQSHAARGETSLSGFMRMDRLAAMEAFVLVVDIGSCQVVSQFM
jgi:hypothetical protein